MWAIFLILFNGVVGALNWYFAIAPDTTYPILHAMIAGGCVTSALISLVFLFKELKS